MKKTILLLGMMIASFCISLAQEAHVHWQRTLGGSLHDKGGQIKLNHGNGYIVCGYSLSNESTAKSDSCRGSYDFWISNLDKNGQVIWDRTIGTGMSDKAVSIIPTSDSGFLVGGFRSVDWEETAEPGFPGDATDTVRGFSDCWILKLDGDGNILWQKTMGGLGDDYIQEIKEVSDGYILLSHSDSDIFAEKEDSCRDVNPCTGCHRGDIWVLKVDFAGNIIWQKTIGGDKGDIPMDILVAASGKIIIGASSYSGISGDKTEACRDIPSMAEGYLDYWVVALEPANGGIIWQKTIGGGRTDFLHSISTAGDSHYLLAGWSTSDASGDKTSQSRDSTYLAESYYIDGGDFWLVTIDTLGNITDQKIIGGNKEDKLSKLVAVPHGYYAVGYSNSGISFDKTDICRGENSGMFILWPDIWAMKLDKDLNIVWQKTIGCALDDYTGDAVYNSADSSLVILASTNSGTCSDKTATSFGEYDYWILKLSEGVPSDIESIPTFRYPVVAFPNPVNDVLNIALQHNTNIESILIYDAIGKIVYSDQSKPGQSSRIDTRSFKEGNYWLRVYSAGASYYKQFTVLRH